MGKRSTNSTGLLTSLFLVEMNWKLVNAASTEPQINSWAGDCESGGCCSASHRITARLDLLFKLTLRFVFLLSPCSLKERLSNHWDVVQQWPYGTKREKKPQHFIFHFMDYRCCDEMLYVSQVSQLQTPSC